MTTFEFLEFLSLNPYTYLWCLLLALTVFGFVMKRTTSSWFNPLRFNIFTFSIGVSVVFFLNYLGCISWQTFTYVICSMVIFWLTFITIFKNKQRNVNITFTDEPVIARYLFYLSYFLFISLTLVSYKALGIPAFNEEGRLSTFTGSNLGFIYRIAPILNAYSVIYIIHLFSEKGGLHKKISAFLFLLPILIIGILSGSRSSFLIIIFAFWGYRTFYLNKEPKASDYKLLAAPMVIFSILSFLINAEGDLNRVFFMVYERIVASGDLYWEALPDETWKAVVVNNPLKFTFMGLLGPLRILNPTQAEIPIGFQLTSIIYPSIAGSNTGPVALFPVFGLVCFGYYGGLIFSFLQSFLVATLLRFTYIKSNSIIVSVFSYYAFNNIITLIGDASAGLGALLDILVNLVVMTLLLLLVGAFYYYKDLFLKNTNLSKS